MASAGISQEVADLLREKHGFTFEKGGAFMSPTGAQVPIMMKEGGIVPGYEPGGYVDPIFAAQRANNEKARAEQEALDAYKASLATAGPTPLEIAQAGYAANQASDPAAAAPFGPLPAAAAVADPNRPGMMMGEAGPFIVPPPAAPVGSATMQSMDVAPSTFSTGSPLPLGPGGVTSVPAAPSGSVGAILKDGTIDNTAPPAEVPAQPELSSVQQVAAELKGLVDTVDVIFLKNMALQWTSGEMQLKYPAE